MKHCTTANSKVAAVGKAGNTAPEQHSTSWNHQFQGCLQRNSAVMEQTGCMPSGGKIPAAIFVSQRPNESAKDCAAAESSHEKSCILLPRESLDCSHGKPMVPGSPTHQLARCLQWIFPWHSQSPETHQGFQASNRRMHRVHTQMALAANLPSLHRGRPKKSRICLFAACANRPFGSLLTAMLNSVKQLQGMSAATCSSCQMMWLKPARSPSQASQADRVTLKEPQLSQQAPVM